MATDFYSAIEKRRSIYGLSNDPVVSVDRLIEILQRAAVHTPTSFNSQTGRIVLLLGENHKMLWDITKETLRKIVPPDSFQSTSDKIDSFAAGYGTVLFFEDMDVVEDFQRNFELYKDNFPIWSLQSSGILQYIVWTAFAIEGIGASLQHYNPLIDDAVKKQWNLPDNWKLISQMPFGKPTAPAGPKDNRPVMEMVRVLK